MERETLVDTSGFYALLVSRDEAHDTAKAYLERASSLRRAFVTTDYVLDETATLLTARRYARMVEPFFDVVFSSRVCRVEWMDPVRFSTTQSFLLKHLDHGYSFTDCFSFEIMRSLRLTKVLSKDHHFRQAGFEPLLV